MTEIQFLRQAVEQLNWNKVPRGLYEPIEYALASGGKRLRPVLTVIAAEMFGCPPEEALPAALAIEIFHNFTLLHDDVMDHASVRRGKPSVHIRWDENTAILSGDQMLIEAYKQLSKLPAEKLPAILAVFNKMGTEICEGQQYDVDFEHREEVSIEEYLNMIRLKTSVLLGTALQIGAMLGNASVTDAEALYRFGVNIGLAFQIQDDVLDVYGNEKTFGKAVGGDILEGKKTFVLLTALRLADEEQCLELHRLLQDKKMQPQQKIRQVTDIYTCLNVRAVCEEVMRDCTNRALANLDKIGVDDDKKQILKKLATDLLARTE
ncbi:MAG: polyprenyl synthetase family protein [Paludibacter sp.]|nr:polyprenyl synthetase family protein [Bacteroidales bacterium]MCM1068445.1 polyprenyl synthetase family protein [Prevotella sp.]MCM1353399.1 polyprenyl synthetase family protein [Bacteroides sp.]MCM1442560.1 polyprenyl synthetase family protein [Muribaculum sp.]MCM1481405.1 polyprenyl synthetase family protein [Paludibacter sp.]